MKIISKLIATLSAVALIFICASAFARHHSELPVKHEKAIEVVKPPIAVGDNVIPKSYSGVTGLCAWVNGDQPFPVDPYSRSQDWVSQVCKVVSISGSCALITPLWPVVPGSYYIWWPIAYL